MRSRQSPLDITIQSWQSSRAQLSTLLDVVVPHTHRWRTLDVHSNSHCLQSILDKINDLKFSSLERATVIATAYIKYPTFLYPENSPALQSLELVPSFLWTTFPLRGITDLSLQLSHQCLAPLTLPSLLLSDKLSTLELTIPRSNQTA